MSNDLKPQASEPRNSEPTVTHDPVPVWFVVLTLILLFLGAVYFDEHSGWCDAAVYAPYKSTGELALYQPKSGAAELAAQGRAAYETICAACHGNDGLGKPGQAPPLAGSEWVAKDAATLAHVPLAGLNGPIHVKGQAWNLSMPPMGAALSDDKLAAVLTYIRSSWGNQSSAISADEVKVARAAGGSAGPSAEELAKMTPVERGHAVFQKYGCFQCHGSDGRGGVANPNAKTAQQVPSLIHVADGYTKAELIAFISRGERNIPRMNPAGPEPPRFMPHWGGLISTNELSDLADYLFSLKPKEEDLGF